MKPLMKSPICKVERCHYWVPYLYGSRNHCTRPDTNTLRCEIRRKLTRKELEEEKPEC